MEIARDYSRTRRDCEEMGYVRPSRSRLRLLAKRRRGPALRRTGWISFKVFSSNATNSGLRPALCIARVIACVALLSATFGIRAAHAQNPKDLHPQGYVSDFAGVINSQTQQQLMAICSEVDKKANAQIAVVTVKSLAGEPIEDFSIDLATRWGIGPKQKDRGVMILLAPNEHQYRFEVGYGIEPILPDGLVGDFGRQARPLLRQGNYSAALLLMTERVARVIAKDRGVALESLSAQPQNLPETEVAPSAPGVFDLVSYFSPLLFFLAFPVLGFLRLLFGGRRRYGRRHSVSWWSGPWILGGLGGGWSGGSWGGGSFGGGGGFGGFGGGSFGGGGASGSW
jgi:uncharacterized protein